MAEADDHAQQPAEFNVGASPIKLLHSVREMRAYTVTASELQQLGLANIATTFTFGLGSALLAFGLDVYKDVALSSEVAPAARALADVVQPICLWLGLGFWAFSGVLVLWRRGMLKTIQNESPERPTA